MATEEKDKLVDNVHSDDKLNSQEKDQLVDNIHSDDKLNSQSVLSVDCVSEKKNHESAAVVKKVHTLKTKTLKTKTLKTKQKLKTTKKNKKTSGWKVEEKKESKIAHDIWLSNDEDEFKELSSNYRKNMGTMSTKEKEKDYEAFSPIVKVSNKGKLTTLNSKKQMNKIIPKQSPAVDAVMKSDISPYVSDNEKEDKKVMNMKDDERVAFSKLQANEKVVTMMNWLQLPKEWIKNALNGEYIITLSGSNINNISDSFNEVEMDDFNLLKAYMTKNSFDNLEKKMKRNKAKPWKCSMCNEFKSVTGNTICCEACLHWYHLDCMGIKKAPASDFFCDRCTPFKDIEVVLTE